MLHIRKNRIYGAIQKWISQKARNRFYSDLILKTNNFSVSTWMGVPIWQNLFDVWIIQEVIFKLKPSLIVECGTNRGGSSFFYANLLDLMGGGKIITVDVERLHTLTHPRIEYVIGSSVEGLAVEKVKKAVNESTGPIFVILDSDHSKSHVLEEMEIYGQLVTQGSYMLVQDGVIDELDVFRNTRPGPLKAIEQFMGKNDDFYIDEELSKRYLISHHPMGWLKKK